MWPSWLLIGFHGSTGWVSSHMKVSLNFLLSSLPHVRCVLRDISPVLNQRPIIFMDLLKFCRLWFMRNLLLQAESRTLVSNHCFLSDIQPGAAPVMMTAWRLNTYNIIQNSSLGVLSIIIIQMLLFLWNHPVRRHFSIMCSAIHMMAPRGVRAG